MNIYDVDFSTESWAQLIFSVWESCCISFYFLFFWVLQHKAKTTYLYNMKTSVKEFGMWQRRHNTLRVGCTCYCVALTFDREIQYVVAQTLLAEIGVVGKKYYVYDRKKMRGWHLFCAAMSPTCCNLSLMSQELLYNCTQIMSRMLLVLYTYVPNICIHTHVKYNIYAN